MSELKSLLHSVDICCPHCEEIIEIRDIDISVTIEGYDISRPNSEAVFDFPCFECGEEIVMTAQLDIGVAKK